LNKALEEVTKIGQKMQLPQKLIEYGQNNYKMAFNNNFIQGRTVQLVAAVCLYTACRQDGKAPYLLIDFADAIGTNMYQLGQVYMQLVKKLCLQLPLVDPCLFIRRFCDRLQFGSKLESVVRLATRFLQSMDRAWITTGRRPNGLCGSAILIAARVLGFRRSTTQIVRVAHVCEETIRKRLSEFKHTNMA
jgi:transcription factor IIIB subunit 2